MVTTEFTSKGKKILIKWVRQCRIRTGTSPTEKWRQRDGGSRQQRRQKRLGVPFTKGKAFCKRKPAALPYYFGKANSYSVKSSLHSQRLKKRFLHAYNCNEITIFVTPPLHDRLTIWSGGGKQQRKLTARSKRSTGSPSARRRRSPRRTRITLKLR